MSDIESIRTFGDVRRVIVDTIIGIRSGSIGISEGMAIAANIKVLNDNINAEINAAKVSLVATEKGVNFGEIVHMGQRLICSE
jgi:hypothetical protein